MTGMWYSKLPLVIPLDRVSKLEAVDRNVVGTAAVVVGSVFAGFMLIGGLAVAAGDVDRAVTYGGGAVDGAAGVADVHLDAAVGRQVEVHRQRVADGWQILWVTDFPMFEWDSKAKRFDLGRYPRGASRSVRFDRPGMVRVFCEIHSHMSAFVLVFAHRAHVFEARGDAAALQARNRGLADEIEGVHVAVRSLADSHRKISLGS